MVDTTAGEGHRNASNPLYDWAKQRSNHLDIGRELGAKRQSVLVMFSGGREIGRGVAKKTRRESEPLFQAGMLLRKVAQQGGDDIPGVPTVGAVRTDTMSGRSV